MSARDAVRRELSKAGKNGRTVMEEWAGKLVAEATDSEAILTVLRWLEGPTPTADALAMERLAETLAELEDNTGVEAA